MVAVGVGVAPMVHTLRAIFRQYDSSRKSSDSGASGVDYMQIILLYGVVRVTVFAWRLQVSYLLIEQRTVADILLREVLEGWQDQYPHMFKVIPFYYRQLCYKAGLDHV